jgi:hypothetical protein
MCFLGNFKKPRPVSLVDWTLAEIIYLQTLFVFGIFHLHGRRSKQPSLTTVCYYGRDLFRPFDKRIGTDGLYKSTHNENTSVRPYLPIRMLWISGNLMEAQRPFFEVFYLTTEDHTDSVHYCFVGRARRNSFIT